MRRFVTLPRAGDSRSLRRIGREMGTRRTIKQGECISSLAFEHGFFPGTLWSAPENRELRELRGDPNVLRPGDVVIVPEKRAKEVALPTGKRHRFRRRGVPEKLKVRLLIDGEPVANEKYELTVDGEPRDGRTDGEGRVDEFISPLARRATLRLDRSRDEIELLLAHLDPIGEITGVQARLANLGFYHGAIDGQLGVLTEEAIQRFQASRALEPYGELDDVTRAALVEAYGG
jgi:N-acetylmuramoyl-L-alanine amidase